MRADVILAGIQLGFIGLQLVFGIIAIITFARYGKNLTLLRTMEFPTKFETINLWFGPLYILRVTGYNLGARWLSGRVFDSRLSVQASQKVQH